MSSPPKSKDITDNRRDVHMTRMGAAINRLAISYHLLRPYDTGLMYYIPDSDGSCSPIQISDFLVKYRPYCAPYFSTASPNDLCAARQTIPFHTQLWLPFSNRPDKRKETASSTHDRLRKSKQFVSSVRPAEQHTQINGIMLTTYWPF